MKILYISKLENKDHAGPTYSVPMQVLHQSRVDDVLWYNFLPIERKEWREVGAYRNSNDFVFSIEEIIARLGGLDLIVFQGFYAFSPTRPIRQILKSGIPYAIIPRSALTNGDQRKSRIKKAIFNPLFYRSFAQNAAFIQYLSRNERDQSLRWNGRSVVLPNGVDRKLVDISRKGKYPVKGVYIGRIEPYQKGLDVLLQALEIAKDDLVSSGFTLDIFGSSRKGSGQHLCSEIRSRQLDFVQYKGPVFGKEKEEVLRESNLFVLTSRYEGLPMGLLEACSFGLPCLITPGTNMTEAVSDKNAGWIADLDAKSIARSLVAAATSTEEQLMNHASGALAVAESFSWVSIAEASHMAYRRFIG